METLDVLKIVAGAIAIPILILTIVIKYLELVIKKVEYRDKITQKEPPTGNLATKDSKEEITLEQKYRRELLGSKWFWTSMLCISAGFFGISVLLASDWNRNAQIIDVMVAVSIGINFSSGFSVLLFARGQALNRVGIVAN